MFPVLYLAIIQQYPVFIRRYVQYPRAKLLLENSIIWTHCREDLNVSVHRVTRRRSFSNSLEAADMSGMALVNHPYPTTRKYAEPKLLTIDPRCVRSSGSRKNQPAIANAKHRIATAKAE
jgi:hypothetical protein